MQFRFNFALPCSFLIAQMLTGCGPTGLFYWGDYENSLTERYLENNSNQAEVYLKESIIAAEHNRYRVPPGVYADYGFMLYRRGDKDAAITYFEKEKQVYPEATALMDKLVERVKQQMEAEKVPPETATKAGGEQ